MMVDGPGGSAEELLIAEELDDLEEELTIAALELDDAVALDDGAALELGAALDDAAALELCVELDEGIALELSSALDDATSALELSSALDDPTSALELCSALDDAPNSLEDSTGIEELEKDDEAGFDSDVLVPLSPELGSTEELPPPPPDDDDPLPGRTPSRHASSAASHHSPGSQSASVLQRCTHPSRINTNTTTRPAYPHRFMAPPTRCVRTTGSWMRSHASC